MRMAQDWRLVAALVIGGAAIAPDLENYAIAQIVPDQTLGAESSVITPNAGGLPVDAINGGATRGTNLFHSFEQFSVLTGRTAFFNNAGNIENIISRVTGSSISNIDGLIANNGGANVFLINPNGIIFGANAQLRIGGSFLASTTSSLNFADGTQFSATNPQTAPLLTLTVPIGLQFGPNPGRILVQGNGQGLRRMDAPLIDTNIALRVQSNQTLALVGGNLRLEGGTLKTNGGRIELGSVAKEGLVSLTPVNQGFSLDYKGVPTFGDIQLSGAAAVDASGENGGNIQVQGRQVRLQGGSQIEATTLGTAPGGTLRINASELVELSGSTADNPQDNRRFPSSLSIDNRAAGQMPGELTISTRQLIVERGARISASNTGRGLGGNITVNASDAVELTGTGISPGGLRSSGLSVQTRGAGNAGELRINTGQLTIRDGAEISASTFSTANGGTVEVNATDAVKLIGTSADGSLLSRLVAAVGDPRDVLRSGAPIPPAATGMGGNLIINTGQLIVQDGAEIVVSSRSEASNSRGAGFIDITARSIRLDNEAAIAAETFSGQGGNITLQVQELLLLRRNSNISTTAGTALTSGDGGNITIDTPLISAVLTENSNIQANAFTGRGGRVDITTQGIFGIEFQENETTQSDITASSEFGVQGEVEINTPEVDPSQGLVALPAEVIDASELIAQGCNATEEDTESKFMITGRGGLPPNPSETLSSDAVWEDTRLPVATANQQPSQTSATTQPSNAEQVALLPATGWVFNNHGEVTLVAQVPNATFYTSGLTLTSCHGP